MNVTLPPPSYRKTFLALFLVLLMSACSKTPTQRLEQHAAAIDHILEAHLDAPKAGVLAAREYYREELPDILSQVGRLLCELDRIDDPQDRQSQARKMLEELTDRMSLAMPHARPFAHALAKDAQAQQELRSIGARWKQTGSMLSSVTRLPF